MNRVSDSTLLDLLVAKGLLEFVSVGHRSPVVGEQPDESDTSPTTAMSTNTAMMARRTQRGARPGATSRDHELV
jgi:hypothetical protein